jgi:hypothetical protein
MFFGFEKPVIVSTYAEALVAVSQISPLFVSSCGENTDRGQPKWGMNKQ